MGLTEAIIVVIVISAVVVGVLAFVMSHPRRLRPHRRAGGRPSARVGWLHRRQRHGA